jgi:iron complex outermembrane recepter protein
MEKIKLTPIALVAFSICSQVFADTAMQSIEVTADRTAAQKYQMPNTVESTTAEKISETVNIIDMPDALKYMPSLMVRKRDSADFGGATLATRIWGVSYSAKSIVTVDGMPISSQLYNDNNYGPPKWFVVSPDEIDRIDVMYGPFSAAYSGNSMGAVVDITTKRPTKEFEGSVSVTEAFQNFSQFKTDDTYNTKQATALLGGKAEAMSWRFLFNHQDANTQPRAFGTGATVTPYPYIKKDGTNGGYYLGATTLLHGVSDNVNAKLKFDLNRDTQLSFNSGVFMGDTDSSSQTYMSNGFCASGAGPCSTLASGVYGYKQEHWVNGVGLKSDTRGAWDYELNLSNVRYVNDVQRTAGALNNDGSVVNNNSSYKGQVRDMSGTNWTNFDAKVIYRPVEAPAHQLSFGYHQDFAKLNNVTNNVTDWLGSNTGTANSIAQGISEAKAIWAQDAYKANERVRYTVGGRYETWTSHDGGVYASSTSALNQPSVSVNHFSPKFAALFDLKDGGLLNLSVANAYRFPTVGELYNVSTCTAGTGSPACSSNSTQPYAISPNAIKPENVNAFEAAYSKVVNNVSYRASFFAEDTKDALISQYGYPNPANPTGLYSYWQNVAKVRSRGVELSSNIEKFIFNQLDLFSAITRVDSVIAANDGYGYGTGSAKSVVGNKTPGVSPLRVKFVATYRPDEKLSISLGGSYQKKFYSTIDNNDVNPNTYLGFEGYTLFDIKARYKVDKNLTASLGVDNLNNRNYFMYHPFPQRTFIGNLKYNF